MNRPLLWARVAVSVFLLIAIADLEYWFYSLVRVVTTVMAVEVAWAAHRRQQAHWLLPFAAIAILWNPIYEIQFPKQTWRVLDVVAAVLFTVSVRYVRETSLFPPRATTVTTHQRPKPSFYIWLTLSTYGSLFAVFLGLPLISGDDQPLNAPWRTAFLALLFATCLGILISKVVYIRHISRNPNVKFKVVWSLVILIIHFWSELVYYAVHVRNPPRAVSDAGSPAPGA